MVKEEDEKKLAEIKEPEPINVSTTVPQKPNWFLRFLNIFKFN